MVKAITSGVTVRECRTDDARTSAQRPKPRALLQGLTSADPSSHALLYYNFRTDVVIAGIPMQIGRPRFSGGLGHELLLPVARTPDLWTAQTAVGQKHGLHPARRWWKIAWPPPARQGACVGRNPGFNSGQSGSRRKGAGLRSTAQTRPRLSEQSLQAYLQRAGTWSGISPSRGAEIALKAASNMKVMC